MALPPQAPAGFAAAPAPVEDGLPLVADDRVPLTALLSVAVAVMGLLLDPALGFLAAVLGAITYADVRVWHGRGRTLALAGLFGGILVSVLFLVSLFAH